MAYQQDDGVKTPKEHAAAPDKVHVHSVVERAFSKEFYLKHYPDVRASGIDPVAHYIRSGVREGRDPSPWFSTRYYLERYPDVAEAGINPLYHYVRHGLKEGRRPVPLPAVYNDEKVFAFVRKTVEPEFDAVYYRTHYPEYEHQILDPLDHFLLIGCRAGNDPSPGFSVTAYLEANADVRASGINPLYHFIVLGRLEGRNAARSSSDAQERMPDQQERAALEGEFDSEFYLHRYPDVRADGMDPLEHYLRFGWREGRDPTPRFSTSYYLRANPDVEVKGINPFVHYIKTGRQENRPPALPGGYVAEALYSMESLERQIEGWMAHEISTLRPESRVSMCARLEKYLADRHPRVVLNLSHDDYRTSVGGVQNCLLLEQQAVVDAGAVYLNLHPQIVMPVLSRVDDLDQLMLVMTCNGENLGIASASTCLDVLHSVRGLAERIDLVVHALLGHSPEFIRLLAETVVNGKNIYWIHDYLSICPGYNLLRNGISYCGIPAAESMACSICVYGEERKLQTPRLQSLFEAVDFTVMTPSEFSADLWKQGSGLQHHELVVMPHTRFSELPRVERAEYTSDPGRDDAALRIAFLGYPSFHKGWSVFRRLVLANRMNPSLEFYLFSVQPINDLVGLRYTEVRVTGGNHSAMVDALAVNRIDIAFIWSIWPETYCITAHEAVAAGVPVLTCEQSGNVARLVEARDCGLVFRDEEEVLAAFESGAIRPMIGALRARMSVRPMALEYSTMSLRQLGLQSIS